MTTNNGGKMPCSVSDGPQFEDSDSACTPVLDMYEELRQQEIDDKIAPMKPLTGWRSDYYDLPDGADGLQDLIEFKNMNFARANIFKAAYRLGEKQGTTELYDIDKILWYAQREKARLLKLEEEAG